MAASPYRRIMRAPVRAMRGRWPRGVGAAAPAAVPDRPTGRAGGHVRTPNRSARAMSLFHVGDTIKITGAEPARCRPTRSCASTWTCDGALVVDIGVSDGIDRRASCWPRGAGGSPPTSWPTSTWRSTSVRDGPVGAVLRARGALRPASPSRRLHGLARASSRTVRAALGPPAAAPAAVGSAAAVMLLGPQARELAWPDRPARHGPGARRLRTVGRASRARRRSRWRTSLRRLYFSDDRTSLRALAALHAAAWTDGGHLLLVDNPRDSRHVGARAGSTGGVGGRFDRRRPRPSTRRRSTTW